MKKILNFIVSAIVGIFIFIAFRVFFVNVFSIIILIIGNQDWVNSDWISKNALMLVLFVGDIAFWFISLILTIKLTRMINMRKSLGVKITLRIMAVIIGLIAGVIWGHSVNSKSQNDSMEKTVETPNKPLVITALN